MDRRKRLKIIAVFMFILAAGTIYSCRSTKKQEPEVYLLNQESTESAQDPGVAESLLDVSSKESSQNQVSQASLQVDESKVPLQSQKDNKTLSVPEDENLNLTTSASVQNNENSIHYIYVHLCGAVKKSDVYKVEEDTRLVDVIALAGGLTEDAAGDFVNQASLLEDGQQIYIPTKEEVKEKTPLEYTASSLPNKNNSSSSSNNSSNSNNSGNSNNSNNSSNNSNNSNNSSNNNSKKSNNGIININTASKEELMTLSGIGEAKAKSIIDYRETHNGFKSIEEIKNIVGIKDSIYNKVKDSISVK